MRLSWNEIRARAATFSQEWAGEGYEKGQTQLFYRDFFDVFGMPVRRVASFEELVRNLGEKRGYIDLFWKGVLLVEQKSIGRDLKKAKTQAYDYFPGLRDVDLPRYILLSDFQTFELYDLEEDESVFFPLTDLSKHVEKFGFIIGVQKRAFKDQDPVNILASELVGRLHDALEEGGYTGHDLEQFLVRIVFCLFADDTGIFEPRGIFLDLLESRTNEDGSDLGGWLSQLFQVLNTPEHRRPRTLDSDLSKFPYVNGDLYRDPLLIPSFNSEMRNCLLMACQFDWSAISPAIFGSLFQSVMNKEERRAQGAHYTTEKNILKVIQPLFLDELRSTFEKLKTRKDSRRKVELEAFHKRLAALTFLDPACGCGNFLIIAYRELRALEIEIVRELVNYERDFQGQFIGKLDVTELSTINVDQFYGIEISEFPARIAETALWMMDHIMNNRLSLEFGQSYVRIPLKKSPHIVPGDALEVDWATLLPPENCSYVLGNPPFGGFHYRDEQRQRQMEVQLAAFGAQGSRIDYVAAWFLKASAYAQSGQSQIAFVATNSITQGEQVAQIWPALFNRWKMEISFAHRTFAWGSDARGEAHVHVVVIGLARRDMEPKVKRLFSYERGRGEPHETTHDALTAYLFEVSAATNRHLVVKRVSRPLNGLPRLTVGSKPVDGGHYILDNAERDHLLKVEPEAELLIHPYLGSREYLNGGDRWIIYPEGASPQLLGQLPEIRKRIAAVRKYRETSSGKLANELAATPAKYHVTAVPTGPFLVIPEVSSERREYIPIGWLNPPVIPSNKLIILPDATLSLFALLTSRMHMAWMSYIGGRLKSDYQYSSGVVYNTFPLPRISEAKLKTLEPLAQSVLDSRANSPGTTLATIYDPDLMPADLRKAHNALDRVVDRLYRKSGFTSDRERVEYLFALYEKLVAPLGLVSKTTKKSKKAKSPSRPVAA